MAIVERPEVEELTRRFCAIQSRVLDARPSGPRAPRVTGDVTEALFPVVLELLAGAGVSELTADEAGTLRWLCGWEMATLARFVWMIQRAHEAGKTSS